MIKLKFFLKSAIGISLFSSVIFLSAGKINFIPGWVYYFLSIFGLLLNIFLIRNNEQLMEERSSLSANTKNWDKKIIGLSVVLTLSAYIIVGLEAGRFNSSDVIGYRYIIAGSLLAVMGQIIFAVAKSQNNYFSSVARIQTDRDHKVCDRGLYKIIRHPGYLGMIISWLGFPLIFGSFFSIIPVFISIILLIIRTKLEDKMLYDELEGYASYSNKTSYKLIPLIW